MQRKLKAHNKGVQSDSAKLSRFLFQKFRQLATQLTPALNVYEKYSRTTKRITQHW